MIPDSLRVSGPTKGGVVQDELPGERDDEYPLGIHISKGGCFPDVNPVKNQLR